MQKISWFLCRRPYETGWDPLVSAFAIAWCIWNWRILLVLIGDGDGGWLAKIDYLDKRLMAPSSVWLLHGLVYPLLFACAWIFVLPPILRRDAVFHEGQSHRTKSAVMAALESAPISREEQGRMWANFLKEAKSMGRRTGRTYRRYRSV
jgi:hypothetical protein